MTTGWGAPRAAYELARDIASGAGPAVADRWEKMTAGDRAGVISALGAQARLAARTAAVRGGAPAAGVGTVLPEVMCAEVRDLAVAAWEGRPSRPLPGACGGCMLAAAEALAGLHLAALEAAGVPRELLAAALGRLAARSA